MNMSNIPFTNIETCNGELAEDDRSRRAYETPLRQRRYRCNSTYPQLIDGGY